MARLTTLDDRIEAAGGHPTGFDALRVVLAVSVILIHSVRACYGRAVDEELVWASPIRGLASLVLPMFFALSGFLVAGSLARTPAIHQFLTLRAVRIVPALAVETLLCALILGPLLTTSSLGEYFTSTRFYSYFLNVVGDVHYYLPGVYEEVPGGHVVNISLWTVPYELECYMAIALLAAVSLTRRPILFAVLVLGICAVVPVAALLRHEPQVLERPHGRVLVAAFLCGIVVFQLRRSLPCSSWAALGALAVSIVVLMSPNLHFWAMPLVAYATACLGVLRAPRLPVFGTGDYSYGMYLFAFPIQQLYAALFPGARIWWLNAAFAVVLSLLYAMFSWHVVEKPVLRSRKTIVGAVDRIVVGAWAAARRRLAPRPRKPAPAGLSAQPARAQAARPPAAGGESSPPPM